MVEIVEIFKKYGGLGIVSCWLFVTNSRVTELESEIRNCNESKIQIYKDLTSQNQTRTTISTFKVAILPEKIKFKRNNDFVTDI